MMLWIKSILISTITCRLAHSNSREGWDFQAHIFIWLNSWMSPGSLMRGELREAGEFLTTCLAESWEREVWRDTNSATRDICISIVARSSDAWYESNLACSSVGERSARASMTCSRYLQWMILEIWSFFSHWIRNSDSLKETECPCSVLKATNWQRPSASLKTIDEWCSGRIASAWMEDEDIMIQEVDLLHVLVEQMIMNVIFAFNQ